MAERRKARKRPAVRQLLIVGLSVLGLATAAWAVMGEIDRVSKEQRAPGRRAAPPSITPTPGRPRPSVQACAAAVRRGEVAVSRARAAITDWAAHVQAMTDLQSGRNTEAATRQIWAQTRARGPTGVAGFRAADAEYRQGQDACGGEPDTGLPAEAAAGLATCRDANRQTDAVLVAARAAVADWAAHLTAMADRVAGRLDPHHAWERWLEAYRAAPVNIEKFEAAERFYRARAPCEAQ